MDQKEGRQEKRRSEKEGERKEVMEGRWRERHDGRKHGEIRKGNSRGEVNTRKKRKQRERENNAREEWRRK